MKKIDKKINEIEFFIADELEIHSFRNEIASMEHPFFALKGGDKNIRKYINGNINITIKPTVDGIATIFDKDIWIYAISKLQEAMNYGLIISRTVYFTPYNFFLTTSRNTSGRSYSELRKTLSRLKGTIIETNIFYKDKQEIVGFGLIDSWRIIKNTEGNFKYGMIEITLPYWLYQSLYKRKILKISSDYFKIRKAIDRRIYEIARKHCGNQKEFIISIEKLYLKTGSTSLLKMFRHNIKQLAKKNNLPEYNIYFNLIKDQVLFQNKKSLSLN
ncbi:replication initiator protein A [Candidatus Palibaumannia cicadellinicola]|uniref:Regulatory protein RepA n=1 Tax=Candidatus Palibaumannia cicadellinicola TaxID=186490 RepID=A0A0K2BLV2_9GAMM|nr:replication initiator protein A [Candidatus Baumannia cicadellinicola]AKZ66174.1 regulatory protein RepA [Candidatus Baumannia cicadellinicola]